MFTRAAARTCVRPHLKRRSATYIYLDRHPSLPVALLRSSNGVRGSTASVYGCKKRGVSMCVVLTKSHAKNPQIDSILVNWCHSNRHRQYHLPPPGKPSPAIIVPLLRRILHISIASSLGDGDEYETKWQEWQNNKKAEVSSLESCAENNYKTHTFFLADELVELREVTESKTSNMFKRSRIPRNTFWSPVSISSPFS